MDQLSMSNKKPLLLIFLFLITSLLVGCIPGFLLGPTATPLPPTLTPTPLPRTLNICLGQEPDSLYPYGTVSAVSHLVMDSLFYGSLDKEGEQLTSAILEKIPGADSGEITLEAANVKNGDIVVDADGNLVTLTAGVSVFPHGCTSAECVLVWDGVAPLQMDKQKISFQLKAGLKWSDGQPLTAADSVYSFQVASDPSTPIIKNEIELTSSYTAPDERTIQWVGKPGLLTTSIEKFFWLPLPQHLWNKFTPGQMLTAEDVFKRPISWGPYMIQNWAPGKSIRMTKNPYYFRAVEGLPKFDFLEFIFLKNGEDPLSAIKSGKCDIVDKSAVSLNSLTAVLESQNSKQVKTLIRPSQEWEILALGIKPVSYDDSYYPYGTDRPAFFDDLRTRQAIASCIDRQGIIRDTFLGQAEIPLSTLPSTDPLMPSGLSIIPYDPARSDQLLTEAGWLDYDKNPATPRVSINVKNVPNGLPFSLNLLTLGSGIHKQIAERISASLIKCGIQVNLISSLSTEIYRAAPEGLVFGRKFDLAQLSIQTDKRSNCVYFNSSEIPTQNNFWMGKTSGGANFTGYSNASLDAACQAGRRAGLNVGLYKSSQQKINQIINQELPVIPLYFTPEITLSRPDLCGNKWEAASVNFLADLDKWEYGPNCK
jgi:peptide/nickel transport system substrate-binding protein